MSIETSYKFHDNYLHFFCQGKYKFEALRNAFKEVFDLAVNRDQFVILVDGMGLDGVPPTTIERFILGEYVAQLCLDHGKPFRISVAGNEPIIDPDRFGEKVARNRGVNGKVFTDLEEAKAWLLR